MVNAEAAVKAVVAEADWVARADKVELLCYGGVAASVAADHLPVLLCLLDVRETEAGDQCTDVTQRTALI